MKYFSYSEFERSKTAADLHIDNSIPASVKPVIAEFVDKVLDPLRQAWGKPLTVTSGYRCTELNRNTPGAAAGSMHLHGRAADITTGNSVDNRRLYQLAQELKLPCFELIGKKYDFLWLHLSYNPSRASRIPS